MNCFRRIQSNWIIRLLIVVGVLCGPTVVYGQEDGQVPSFLRDDVSDSTITIKTISVVDRDTDWITLRWQTTNPSYGRIQYGQDRSDLDRSRSFMNPASDREITLRNLQEGTNYYFQIKSWTTKNNGTKSELGRFRTAGTPPPQFESISLHEKTSSGGTIRITTNIPVSIVFQSGHDTNLDHSTAQPSRSRRHQISLDHFFPDRTVYYHVRAEDSRGRTVESGLKTFRTRENNVAYQKPVSGTFNRAMYDAPDGFGEGEELNDRITDDDFSFMNGTATSGDPGDTTQWFTVNVRELVQPETVVLFWFAHATPKNYKIEASQFGQDWEVLADSLNARDGQRGRVSGINTFKQVVPLDDVEKTYQFFRVRIPKGAPYHTAYNEWKYVQIQEFKLFPRSEETESPEFQSGRKSLIHDDHCRGSQNLHRDCMDQGRMSGSNAPSTLRPSTIGFERTMDFSNQYSPMLSSINSNGKGGVIGTEGLPVHFSTFERLSSI